MVRTRYGYRSSVPSISSSKTQTRSISYKKGVNTFKDNDDVAFDEVIEARDARFVKIGRYKTRKGADRASVPIGEAINVQITSTTGASTLTIGGEVAFAQRLTTTAAGRATRVDINVGSTTSSRGVLLVELYSNNSGTPGILLATTSIAPSSISTPADYETGLFIEAPELTNGQVVWVVIRPQSASVQGYELTTTTSSPVGLQSTDSGATWVPAGYNVNVKLYTAANTPVKGLYRAYRPNGSKLTMFAYDNTVASVNDSNGATSVLKSDFTGGSTHYRARLVQDAVYWVNGVEKPWKYDFTNWTQLSAAPYTPSLIEEHKGLLFFNDVDDKTRIFYSNFAEFDRFTSTDFIYVPAPKSYDSITAFAKLNGVLYIFANRNKFALFGADNDTFSLDEASSQRGTFSQESLVYDANFIYHADEEGIWQFNGTSERNLAEPFLEDYLAIPDKSTIQLDISQNRLYCFFTPAGEGNNSKCFVMNLQLGVYESLDTGTFIGRTFGRYAQDNLFIQGSNRVAALYYGELETNDHSNLGAPLEFAVKTAYSHFDRPAENKRIPKWRPQFPSQTGDYTVQAGYDLDGQNNPQLFDVSLSGSGPRLNTGVLLNTGARVAGQRMIEPTNLFIPGNFKRVQRIYQHVAAREPVELDSESMTIETQRMI